MYIVCINKLVDMDRKAPLLSARQPRPVKILVSESVFGISMRYCQDAARGV